MASLATLFNLDPTQFALGRSTGRLQGIVSNPTQQNQVELGNLLNAVKTVTAEQPGEFTATAPVMPDLGTAPVAPVIGDVPTPTGGAASYLNLSGTQKALLELDASAAYGELVAALKERNSIPGPTYRSGILSGMVEPYIWSDEASLRAGNYTPSKREQDAYRNYVLAERMDRRLQSWLPDIRSFESTYNTYKTTAQSKIDEYNKQSAAYKAATEPKVAAYNTDVAAYNKILGEYKSKVDAYNADVSRYQREVEDTRNKFQKEYLSQNVNQELIPAEGEILAASSLYSDTLHQEMINKIAESNAAEPGTDRVTSLYAPK